MTGDNFVSLAIADDDTILFNEQSDPGWKLYKFFGVEKFWRLQANPPNSSKLLMFHIWYLIMICMLGLAGGILTYIYMPVSRFVERLILFNKAVTFIEYSNRVIIYKLKFWDTCYSINTSIIGKVKSRIGSKNKLLKSIWTRFLRIGLHACVYLYLHTYTYIHCNLF